MTGRTDFDAGPARGSATDATPPISRHPRGWPTWVGYVAAAWSLIYGALGLYWATGGGGFPFGTESDPGAKLSLLAGVRRETAAPVIAVLGIVGAAAGVTMSRALGRGALRTILLAFGWVSAAWLALLLPDFRVLAAVAYAIVMIVGAPFGWPPEADWRGALTWPLENQFLCIVGGVLWGLTSLSYQRRTRNACPACGRSDSVAAWTTPEEAVRWGRRAVYVSVVIPLVYAVTRWAWAIGIPLGISEELFREGQASGMWWSGAALGTLAVVGAGLTLGLVQRWGETFPRWVPSLGGRRVPPLLAIVPAAAVSVIVASAGLMFVRFAITGTFTLGKYAVTLGENWAGLAPELLWPIWGVALAAATLAYYYRTRGRCTRCGRG